MSRFVSGSCVVRVRFVSGSCPLRVWFVSGFGSGFVSGFMFGSCPFVSGCSCLVRVWFVFGSYTVVVCSRLVRVWVRVGLEIAKQFTRYSCLALVWLVSGSGLVRVRFVVRVRVRNRFIFDSWSFHGWVRDYVRV